MVFAFDTLSFARHLRENGVPQEQAEAHAEAVRTFVMVELVTKQDLNAAVENIHVKLENVNLTIENLKLALTVRLGAMLFLAVGALAALQKLT
jgi:hypothetical protein